MPQSENPNPILGNDQQKAAGNASPSKGDQTAYFKQIAEYPRLTEQEELHYTRQFFEETQAFIAELKKFPSLLLHALEELDSRKNDIRIGNIIELSEAQDATSVRTQLPHLVEQLKQLPKDDNFQSRFHELIMTLPLRPAFFEHCYDILKQNDMHKNFMSDDEWKETQPRLEAHDQLRKEASTILVERSLRLVISNAQKYVRDGVALADLIQEGTLGLMKGVEKFDYRLGYRLSTYVTYWINQAIMRSLTNTSRIIRISASTLKQISAIRAAADEILQKTGEEPRPEAIADAIGMSTARVSALLKMAEQPISLQATTEQEKQMEEIIPDDNAPPPNAEADFASLKDSIKKALANLNERERFVIVKRFGLDEKDPLTFAQIAEQLNISGERIRQIEASAIKKLRSPESMQFFDGYH